MALPFPISPGQTDANSPVDDNLMDSIRLDLDYLDNVLSTQGAILSFNINGPLAKMSVYKKAIDTVALYNPVQFTTARAVLKKSGVSGTLRMDLRRISSPRSPITGIDHFFEAVTQSIGNINPALATQSIQRSTPQIATQSITYAKAQANIQSIINVGTNLWRYNLDITPDVDWTTAQITFASATAGGNNGTFPIVELNQSGFPSVVISNPSGVAQPGAAGTGQINIMSYNFVNPVSAQFTVGDQAVFASHTSGLNNGTFTIFKTNSGGNNIWVVNIGATQGGVAGNANNLIWIYTFTVAAGADFAVGELAKFTSHTSGGNNGNLLVRSINTGGNNLYVYNTAGVAQAGVAGSVGTNRWSYGLSVDPAASITAGDTVQLEGHTNPANNLITTVKQVDRLATDNIIIYNVNGVVQGSAVGFVRTAKKIVKFATDQSANYTTGTSLVDLIGLQDALYNYNSTVDSFPVLEQNHGGGANFNLVISAPGAASQASPAGYVYIESKSILTAPFNLAADPTANHSNRFTQVKTTSFVTGVIPDNTPIGLFILSMQSGDVRDLTVIMH